MRSPFQWWDRTVSLGEQRSWEFFLERLRVLRRLRATAELTDADAGRCPEQPRVFERRENASWCQAEDTTPQELLPILAAEYASEVLERAHRFASEWESRLFPLALRRLGSERIRGVIEELHATARTPEPHPGWEGPAQPAPDRLRPLWADLLALPELQLLEPAYGTENWGGAIPGRLSDTRLEAEIPCCLEFTALLAPAEAELASQVRHLLLLERFKLRLRTLHPTSFGSPDAVLDVSLQPAPDAASKEGSGRCRLVLRSRV